MSKQFTYYLYKNPQDQSNRCKCMPGTMKTNILVNSGQDQDFFQIPVCGMIALLGFTLVLTGASLIWTVLVEKSKSLWVGVLLHTSHNVILMGMFKEMTLDKGYAYYLVSETGVFLGIVYILVAIVFWRIQVRSIKSSS